jgi:hypothetical protein
MTTVLANKPNERNQLTCRPLLSTVLALGMESPETAEEADDSCTRRAAWAVPLREPAEVPPAGGFFRSRRDREQATVTMIKASRGRTD